MLVVSFTDTTEHCTILLTLLSFSSTSKASPAFGARSDIFQQIGWVWRTLKLNGTRELQTMQTLYDVI